MFYFKRTLGLLAGTSLVFAFSIPAYGIGFQQDHQAEVLKVKTDSPSNSTQKMVNNSTITVLASRDEVAVTEIASTSNVGLQSSPIFDASSLPANQGILSAAFAQLGSYLDCTAVVENALKANGYSVPDIGPMQFSSYGVRVDPSQAQAGDIMMRPGHVAIYAGNGMAVHGGFNGLVVYTDGAISSPHNYSIIVRI